MNSDELRALADALDSYPPSGMTRAADYLRACADAQPVAYRQWNKWNTQHEGYWYYGDASCAEKDDELLYTHPAPAAPQAEPKREPACLWSRADDDTDVWETGCGHAFTIIDGTPGDNQMEFCCYCGRRVDEEIGGSDAE